MRTLSGLWIDRSARPTLQDQLARQIRERIRSGDLAPGDPLPSTRDLASELKLSRNTAVYAYERLISEGYLESASRAGIFVSRAITMPRDSKRAATWKKNAPRSAAPVLQPHLTAPRPFRPCQPDVGLFPLLTWNRMRGRALRREDSVSFLSCWPRLQYRFGTWLTKRFLHTPGPLVGMRLQSYSAASFLQVCSCPCPSPPSPG